MKKPIAKVVLPKGYKFKIELDGPWGSTYIYLMKDKYPHPIGRVELEVDWADKTVLRTHSHLNSLFHHKGFGTLMYARAIQWGLQHKYKVRSSGMTSNMARRVWGGQGLKKYFDIKQHKSKDKKFTWYAYPKR